MMAERHRLGGLQMGESGHYGGAMRQCFFGQRLLIGRDRFVDRVDGGPNPEPEIGCHLVVARARGVQPPGRRPDQFRQPALDIHMDVFERSLECEFAALDFHQDGV